MTPESLGTHAGSGALGTIIAWFTLRGKIEKLAIAHKEFVETTKEAIKEIKESAKSHNEKVVYADTCEVCKDNRDNQFKAINDKLDLLLERRKTQR